jgi:AcrR family transcriptional regulator
MKTSIKAEAEVPRKGNEPAWRQRAVSRSLSAARSRAEQRVQRFLDTAFELIDERGTTEFTIQEVVDRSKQSVRAFYQCFDGKDELLLALTEENTRESVEDIREVIESESDPIARLRAFVIRLHEWCEPAGTPRKRSKHDRRPISEFSLQLAVDHPERLWATLIPISRMLRELVEDAVAAGAIKVADTRRATVLIQQTVMFGWFGNRLIPNQRMRITADEAWDFCLYGLHAVRVPRIHRGNGRRSR